MKEESLEIILIYHALYKNKNFKLTDNSRKEVCSNFKSPFLYKSFLQHRKFNLTYSTFRCPKAKLKKTVIVYG